jgi:hypothetical protein
METSNQLARGLRLFTLISGFMLAWIHGANAEVFYVPDTIDSVGVTSLRGAIIAANQIGGNNTIILGPPPYVSYASQARYVYRLTISGPDEALARTGDLELRAFP